MRPKHQSQLCLWLILLLGLLASLAPAGQAPGVRPDAANYLLLNATHLDTRRPEVKALRTSIASFAGSELHLVQFSGPIQRAWLAQLTNSGVRIVTYVPQNAYLVYGDQPSLTRLQSLARNVPFIQWDGPYLNAYKMPAIDPTSGAQDFAVQMVFDKSANSATRKLIDHFALTPIRRDDRCLGYRNVIVHLNPAVAAAIAAQPDVISVRPHLPPHRLDERQDQIAAGNLSGIIPSGPNYLAWLQSKGFTQAQFDASAFAVDVSDSGIDNGTTTPTHFGLYVAGFTTNASRVLYNRLEGTPNPDSTLAGCDGHGTLNAHIIAGYDNDTGFPFTDDAGYHYGLGVCPFAYVGSSVIYDPDSTTSPNFVNLQSDAYHSGARISNNSWGGNLGYDIIAQTFDALVRDAQPTNSDYAAPGNQEMTIVVAAANNGEPFSITSPGTAKNVITVGASQNVQPLGDPDGCDILDSQADDASRVWNFSSRGPCPDGRNKPDLIAPGTHVSGGVVQAPDPGPLGTADPCFNAYNICGGTNGDIFYPGGQQFYTVSSGTSHAAPCVSGACALLRQFFINNSNNPPSPAMCKAYLMSSTRYMTGAGGDDTLWSESQGMGSIDLGTAFESVPRILRDEIPSDMFTESGQVRSYTGVIVNTNKPFRVTVAWTDAPGNTTGAAWNNDLDLRVTAGGVTYLGNVFKGAYSVPGGSPDYQNNVESVFLPAGTSGPFSVQIVAANINSDGVPNNDDPLDQDFALVIFNAEPVAAPFLAQGGTTLITEGCQPTNGAVDPDETVTVNFTLQNVSEVDASNIVATLAVTNGISWALSANSYETIPAGASVSMPFTFTANGSCGSAIRPTLNLQGDNFGPASLAFPITLGSFNPTVALSQNFDSVTAPALPDGWATSASGGQQPWTTVSSGADSPTNAAFSPCPIASGENELDSPPFAISSSVAQLTFRQSFSFQVEDGSPASSYDAAVLEIKIATNNYADILTAGGSFVSGGYNGFIYNPNNPINLRETWCGDSGGYETTTVRLPASAAGQTVQLRWRCGSGYSIPGGGWWIDSISISDSGAYTCCSSSAQLSVTQLSSPALALTASNLTYTVIVSNLGPSAVGNVTLRDASPVGAPIISTSVGAVTNDASSTWDLGFLPVGASTNLTIVVLPDLEGLATNIIDVSSPLAGDSTTNVTPVYIFPSIDTQPTDQIAPIGSRVQFTLHVKGSGPLGYEWFFQGATVTNADNALMLTNIQPSQAGTYWVVITNIVGSVTSAPVSLVVLQSPSITAAQSDGVGFSLQVMTLPGVHYTLQYKDSLSDPAWISLGPPVLGTGDPITFEDANQMTSSRFYRVIGD